MGIRHEFNCRYTPEQNRVAKRKNHLVVEAAREMLEEKSMPKFYWAKAVRTAVYIQNWIGENMSAHELYFGRKLNVRHLKVFESIAVERQAQHWPHRLSKPRTVSVGTDR